MATILQQAINLAKSGNRAGAEALLKQVVFDDPENEAALMWLSAVTTDSSLRREALEQVSQLNPQHPLAQKGISRFVRKKPSASPPAPMSETPAETPDLNLDFGAEEEATPPAPTPTSDDFSFDFGAETSAPAPAGDAPAEEAGFNFDFSAEEETATPEPAPASEDTGFDFGFDFGGDSEMSPLALDLGSDEEADDGFSFDFIEETPASSETTETADDDSSDDFNFDALFNTDEETSLDDLAEEIAPDEAPADEPPPFSFDFDAEDSPPAFETETAAPDDATSLEPPPFDFTPEPIEESSSDAFDWNLFATGGPPIPEEDPTATDDEADEFLDRLNFDDDTVEEAAIIIEEDEDEDDDDDKGKKTKIDPEQAKLRQQKQNRMLIIGTIIFSIIVVSCCGIYYYVYEVADRFAVAPQLAPDEMTVPARNPRDGVSTLKFYGFPASRARVNWTANEAAETCGGSTTGLEVDFQNGELPSRFNNRVCTADGCSFDKELPPGPISKVTVTYICGEAAEITLFK